MIVRSITAAMTAVASIAAGIASQSGHGVPGNSLAAVTDPASAADAGELSTNDT